MEHIMGKGLIPKAFWGVRVGPLTNRKLRRHVTEFYGASLRHTDREHEEFVPLKLNRCFFEVLHRAFNYYTQRRRRKK